MNSFSIDALLGNCKTNEQRESKPKTEERRIPEPVRYIRSENCPAQDEAEEDLEYQEETLDGQMKEHAFCERDHYKHCSTKCKLLFTPLYFYCYKATVMFCYTIPSYYIVTSFLFYYSTILQIFL